MSRRDHLLFSRWFLCAAIQIGLAASAACALPHQGASHPHQKKQPGPSLQRSSIDPPTLSQGNLSQDLFLAIEHGDLAGVKSLLTQGADPNARNSLMYTALDHATVTGQTEVMKALLQAGAKLEADSPYGTALTFAALGGSDAAIHLLLSRGAQVNVTRPDGLTPIALAARSGSNEGLRELLKRGAQVNVRDNDGATPLFLAAREGHVEAGRILLAAGGSVDGADRHGWTPLMEAAVNGRADFVQLLLDRGANPNARDARGRTPMLLTATYGDYPEVVRALLKAGANPGATDAAHRTAHVLAVTRGHGECARLLGDSEAPAPGSTRTVREAVQASLSALEGSMREFNRRTGCVSCHQEGLGRMATGAARDRGFVLDPAIEKAQMERLNGGFSKLEPLHARALKDQAGMKQLPMIELDEVSTAYSFLLAGMAAHRQPATPALETTAMVLARQQLPAGNWQFVLPRVPMQSSNFTFTALSVLSLQAYGPKASAAEITERIQRARDWMLSAPATTNEDRAFRLLGLKWAGASAEARQKAMEALRAEQRPDGGWSQLPNMHSDAYATGESLYALHLAGDLPTDDPVYQRGIAFLLRTQDEDGSWFVNKRSIPVNNYFDAGFPHGEAQFSSFNGTCWATMALLQATDRI